MAIRTTVKLVIGLVVLVAICGMSIYAVETPKKIRILYTDDMMGNWKPCG